MKKCAQDSADGWPAVDDVVISAVDNRAMDDSEGESIEESKKIPSGIASNMRRQAVAKRFGKVIHEGDISKVIVSTPINTVSFEWVASIWKEKDQPAARRFCLRIGGTQCASDFFETGSIILYMF